MRDAQTKQFGATWINNKSNRLDPRGRKEGRKTGRKEGRKKGRKEGRKDRKEGKKEGRIERKERRKEGRKDRKKQGFGDVDVSFAADAVFQYLVTLDCHFDVGACFCAT